MPSAAHPGLRERVDPDLPGPPQEARVPRIDEPFPLEGFQGSRDVTAKEAGAFRDTRLGSLAARFADVPEDVEVEEDALRRGELHGVPMRSRLLKSAARDSHAFPPW